MSEGNQFEAVNFSGYSELCARRVAENRSIEDYFGSVLMPFTWIERRQGSVGLLLLPDHTSYWLRNLRR